MSSIPRDEARENEQHTSIPKIKEDEASPITNGVSNLQLERTPSSSAASEEKDKVVTYERGMNPKLRYIKPYWWPYKTFIKERWIGRQLLEVISTEFRDRSMEYYRHALDSGVTRVNGIVAKPDQILKNGDRLDNTVHRHEPPITNDPILVLHLDRERQFVVISKPGSVPVHATGRYFRHSVLEIMEQDHGIKCYSVNRLDRLTSGLMILALSGKAASNLAKEFVEGKVKKEYVARVRGKFPDQEITVDQPLLTVDRQMGLVIVTPEGKDAVTIFKRMSYDAARDQSVVHCRPQTGRTHQIRVHLQYLGYPIANDPLYSEPSVWGPKVGRGGVDLTPSAGGMAKAAALAARVGTRTPEVKEVDREYDNIDLTSPIRLSQQARDIIAKLRRQKDEAEDWIKWKEVVFTAKAAQEALEVPSTSVPSSTAASSSSTPTPPPAAEAEAGAAAGAEEQPFRVLPPLPLPETTPSPLRAPAYLPPGFCKDCFVPLPDDPDPETLFIYLHALRYTTEALGTWATPLPRWAGEGWDGDWRGWAEGAELPPMPIPETKERAT